MLSVKEFLNVKPLILLIGFSRVQDLHSAKRFISALCLNTDKGSLIDKIGNLLKTHLDFIAWFLSLKKYLQINLIKSISALFKCSTNQGKTAKKI